MEFPDSQPVTETIQTVEELKEQLGIKAIEYRKSGNKSKVTNDIINLLYSLEELQMTVGNIRDTKIGRLMTKYANEFPDPIKSHATRINNKWKDILRNYREAIKQKMNEKNAQAKRKIEVKQNEEFSEKQIVEQRDSHEAVIKPPPGNGNENFEKVVGNNPHPDTSTQDDTHRQETKHFLNELRAIMLKTSQKITNMEMELISLKQNVLCINQKFDEFEKLSDSHFNRNIKSLSFENTGKTAANYQKNSETVSQDWTISVQSKAEKQENFVNGEVESDVIVVYDRKAEYVQSNKEKFSSSEPSHKKRVPQETYGKSALANVLGNLNNLLPPRDSATVQSDFKEEMLFENASNDQSIRLCNRDGLSKEKAAENPNHQVFHSSNKAQNVKEKSFESTKNGLLLSSCNAALKEEAKSKENVNNLSLQTSNIPGLKKENNITQLKNIRNTHAESCLNNKDHDVSRISESPLPKRRKLINSTNDITQRQDKLKNESIENSHEDAHHTFSQAERTMNKLVKKHNESTRSSILIQPQQQNRIIKPPRVSMKPKAPSSYINNGHRTDEKFADTSIVDETNQNKKGFVFEDDSHLFKKPADIIPVSNTTGDHDILVKGEQINCTMINEDEINQVELEDFVSFSQAVDSVTDEIDGSDVDFLRTHKKKARTLWNNHCKNLEGVKHAPLIKTNGRYKAAHKVSVGKQAIQSLLNKKAKISNSQSRRISSP